MFPVISKLAVNVFLKHYYDLVETIIDNNLDDFFMVPVYLLQFAYAHKQSFVYGLPIEHELVEFCIFPPSLTVAERKDPSTVDFFSLYSNLINYEQMLF